MAVPKMKSAGVPLMASAGVPAHHEDCCCVCPCVGSSPPSTMRVNNPGTIDDDCADCEDFDGNFDATYAGTYDIGSYKSCWYVYTFSPILCTYETITVEFVWEENTGYWLFVTYTSSGASGNLEVHYEKSYGFTAPVCALSSESVPFSVDEAANPECVWPATVTVTAI